MLVQTKMIKRLPFNPPTMWTSCYTADVSCLSMGTSFWEKSGAHAPAA